MFATIESFSLFFFAGLAIIFLLIAFEDKLEAVEKKHNRKKAKKRAAARAIKNTEAHRNNIRNTAVRNVPSSSINRRGFAA